MPVKILIIGPAWVGDMVMAQTLFKVLKRQQEQNQIDVLAPAWTFSLLSRMPEVSAAIEMPMGHGELKLGERWRLAKQMREKSYDQAIVLPNSFKSALIPWFARIKRRSGWVGESRFILLNDVRYLDKKRLPLMIEQYMALGLPANTVLQKPYPHPSFHISDQSVEQALQTAGLARPLSRVLAMSPGAEFGPSKRWPAEYYATVARTKLAAGWQVWLFGSAKDRVITDEIMKLTGQRCMNLAGQTSLAGTIDLLSVTTGLITNDSGLMHVAAALNKPVIALYGSTSPAFTPPLTSSAEVLKLNLACQPCFKRECPLGHHLCMQELLPETVIRSIEQWELD